MHNFAYLNKAGYTASGAPKHLDKRRRYGWTGGRTDGWTDRPSYRDASTHLKSASEIRFADLLINISLFVPKGCFNQRKIEQEP